MLKVFRKYNKLILAVGGSILMVTFLITGPVLQVFSPNPQDQVLGHIGSREVTLGDQSVAGIELTMLRRLGPVVSQLTPESSLHWILMQEEARQMGISASMAEAWELINVLGLSESDLQIIARDLHVTQDYYMQTIRQWIAVQNYRELLMGSTHESILTRLAELDIMIRQMQEMGGQQAYMRQYMMMQYMQQLDRILVGKPRVSRPLIERFISDQQSQVKASFVRVPSDRYLDKVQPPTEEELQALYDQNKDDLPGVSQPYGFGYKFNRRVKLEYLGVPNSQLRRMINIPESEAIAYYEENRQQYTTPAPPAAEGQTQGEPTVKPYKQVRSQIVDRLRDEKAKELGDKIIKSAQSILLEDARNLEQTNDGYREVPEDWQPLALEEVAKRVQQEFDILPTVEQKNQTWLGPEELSTLDGIGSASIAGQMRFGFVAYVLSAKELEPAEDAPMYALRLQSQIPSLPLVTFDGSYYLFRLTAAEPERQPVNLDEVRHAVSQDLKRVKAYELAKADIENWKARLKKDSLLIIAQELGQTISEPPPFPQRDVSMGGIRTPTIEPFGEDEQLVNNVFNLAETIVANNTGAIEGISPDKRSSVFPVKSDLSLAVVRIDAYRPIREADFQRMATMPYVQGWIQQAMLQSGSEGESIDPFALEELQRRVGYTPERETEEEDAES